MRFRAVLACALAIAGCSKQPAPPAQSSQPAAEQAPKSAGTVLEPEAQKHAGIVVEQARSEPTADVIAATGQLTLNEDETWSVGVLSNGRIVSVSAKPGDFVRKGQVLARMYSDAVHDARTAYKQASLEVSRLEAAEAQARRVRDRARRLLGLKAASRQEVELAEAEFRNAAAAVQSARTEMERERRHLVEFLGVDAAADGSREDDFIPVKAVESGIIIERKAAPGAVVSAGEEVFRISTPNSIWMIANVNEADLAALRVGQSVRVVVRAYPERQFQGRILRLGEELDPTTRTLKVPVLVPNPGRLLKPEMYASAEIVRASASKHAVFIADTAIQDLHGNRVVFVRTAENRFEPRPVQTGRAAGGRIEVIHGIQPGEWVVSKGAFVVKSQLLKSALEEE